jgi:hypothetical protein
VQDASGAVRPAAQRRIIPETPFPVKKRHGGNDESANRSQNQLQLINIQQQIGSGFDSPIHHASTTDLV